MRALATALVLVATSASAAPPGEPAAAEAAAIDPSPSATAPTAAPVTAASPAAPASSAAPARAAVVPAQPVIDRLGEGDRLLLAGDARGALFAYQDAVYAQPTYAPARVRLGRAYLALRYPDLAIEQAEAALAEDPDSAEASKLLEEARAAPPRPKLGAAVAPSAPAASLTPASAPPGGRVFKLTPDGGAAPVAAAPAPAADAPVSASQRQLGAQHYRAALAYLQHREWASAVAALSDAILADPTLAVAYSARGSAQFGLGKYREASEDYAAAMRLDPGLATPVYGLAECYRVLGDGKKAAELYDRYAASGSADVRADLRALARKRADDLR